MMWWTIVLPHDRDLPARKLWIAFAVGSSGVIRVDAGARKALERGGTSLLAAGVVSVDGRFDGDDAVEIMDDTGEVFAKGLTRMSSDLVASVVGRSSADLPDGVDRFVVHVDDLVILP
jgi:glutamate 5-kinase